VLYVGRKKADSSLDSRHESAYEVKLLCAQAHAQRNVVVMCLLESVIRAAMSFAYRLAAHGRCTNVTMKG